MRFIVFVVVVGGIGLAALWTSRATAPHVSEAQADAIALNHAMAIYHHPSMVVSAQFFADGGRSESKPGEQWPGQDCALPIDICHQYDGVRGIDRPVRVRESLSAHPDHEVSAH